MSGSASAGHERHVVVLVYPNIMAMDVCGPMEAFAMANILAKRDCIVFRSPP
jgi:transcriptional regulator GlxA family with amidase domain